MLLGVRPIVFLARLLVFFALTYLLWERIAPTYTQLLAGLTQAAIWVTEWVGSPETRAATTVLARGEGIFFIHKMFPEALLPGIPADWVQANMVLLIPLMLATPAPTWRTKVFRLALALGIAMLLQVFGLVVAIKSIWATQLGAFSMQHYGRFHRTIYNFLDAFFQAWDTQLFPVAIWGGIHLRQLLAWRRPPAPAAAVAAVPHAPSKLPTNAQRRRARRRTTLGLVIALGVSADLHAIDESKLVDLTYTYDADTVYWPTAHPFQLEVVSHGRSPGGYFYAANNFCSAEHGGTHMDAPIHFAEGKATADQVPLSAGVGPIVRVDVSEQAATDPDYRLSIDDLRAWEARHGRIPDGAIVIMYSGWGTRWPDRKRYLGSDQPKDTVHLHFPGFSKEAAQFLVSERSIDAIGVDTASIDYGQSQDFIVHQVINGANKPGYENLANLDRVPPVGATLIALPMKIGGGSGGPLRAVALLP